MFCTKCGARLSEYRVDPELLKGRFYYYPDNPEDHPWIWVKEDGSIIEKI